MAHPIVLGRGRDLCTNIFTKLSDGLYRILRSKKFNLLLFLLLLVTRVALKPLVVDRDSRMSNTRKFYRVIRYRRFSHLEQLRGAVHCLQIEPTCVLTNFIGVQADLTT